MDSFQWFILAILGLIALVGCHRRFIRYRIIKVLKAQGASTNDIVKIMEAYKGEQDNG